MEIQPKQIIRIQSAMSSRCNSRNERLEFLSGFFQRQVKSTKELNIIEADDLIYFLNTGKVNDNNWAYFDKSKFPSERKMLFSLLYQAQWTVPNERHNEVPDLERLSNFLKSARSPVNKPLKQFEKEDWKKIIHAFTQIVKFTHK